MLWGRVDGPSRIVLERATAVTVDPRRDHMPKIYLVLFVLLMIGIIVAVDFIFLRHNTGLRLAVNVGIVAVFVAVYFLVLRKHGG